MSRTLGDGRGTGRPEPAADHAADKDHLSPQQIADRMQISPRQALRVMDEMPSVRVGKKMRRVAVADFEAWVARNTQQPMARTVAMERPARMAWSK